MKRICTSLVFVLLGIGPVAFAQDATPKPLEAPKTIKDQAGYGIGIQIGRNLAKTLKSQKLDVNPTMIARGFLDALLGKKPALSDAQIATAMGELDKQAEANRKNAGTTNQESGAAFLAANKKKPGVKTLPSGMQYKILKTGSGASPKPTDRVRTHYHGTLIDGTVFDSSVDRGEPAEFPVNRVIAGWTEALQLMKVGDKWQLFIPPEMAYGDRGAGTDIGPNTTLIFDVELLDILK